MKKIKYNAYNVPRIAITDIRRNPYSKIANSARRDHGLGFITCVPPFAPPMKVHFQFKIGEQMGYAVFQYVWKQTYRKQLVEIIGHVNNYSHRKFEFKCFNCKRLAYNLFFTRGPIWECRTCANVTGSTRWSQKSAKKTLRQLSEISKRSTAAKLRALDAYIQTRERIREKFRI